MLKGTRDHLLPHVRRDAQSQVGNIFALEEPRLEAVSDLRLASESSITPGLAPDESARPRDAKPSHMQATMPFVRFSGWRKESVVENASPVVADGVNRIASY